jgi:NTE family protein
MNTPDGPLVAANALDDFIDDDLWSARGEVPRDMVEIEVRLKDIQYSSRTRAATDQYKRQQKLRLAFTNLLNELPENLRAHKDVQPLKQEADDKVCNIVQLIYNCQELRKHCQRFRILLPHNGGALARRIQRRRSGTRPP